MQRLFSQTTRGFYDRSIHGEAIPPDAVEVTDERYAALIAGQAQGQTIMAANDGSPVLHDAFADPAAQLDLTRISARLRMQGWIEEFLKQFTAGVPVAEIASWTRKSDAARAHLGGSAATPMLLAEAALTGETTAVLAAKIAAKATAYELIIARVTGLRRATIVAIDAAHTPEAVEVALQAALAAASAMITEMGLQIPATSPAPVANKGA